jgi:hypothetical protein
MEPGVRMRCLLLGLLALCVACQGSSAGRGLTGADAQATPDAAGPPSGDADDATTSDVDGAAPDTEPDMACSQDADCEGGGACVDPRCVDGRCALKPSSQPCDDADPCTTDDRCSAGTCLGVPLDCGDGVACTIDACEDGQCAHEPAPDPECALLLVVDDPPRGATRWGDAPVEVSGRVWSPVAPISSLRVDGQDVDWSADGRFSLQRASRHGINLLEIEAQDEMGREARHIQTYLHGASLHPPAAESAPLPEAIAGWLHADIFDDGDPDDLDDLASFAWWSLDRLDVATAIPHPLTAEGQEPSWGWCTWTLDVGAVSYDVVDVDVETMDGGLHLGIDLTDLAVYFEAVAPWCPDAKGWAMASEARVDAWLSASVGEVGALEVALDEVQVTISEVEIDLTGGAASLFDWVINWYEDNMGEVLSSAVESWVASDLVPLMTEALEDLVSYGIPFQIPAPPGNSPGAPMELNVRPRVLDFSPEGLAAVLDVSLGAEAWTSHEVTGSIARAHCGGPAEVPYALSGVDPMEAAIREDLVNQCLFALWASDAMHVSLSQEVLGEDLIPMSFDELNVLVDPHGPPVVVSCDTGGALSLEIGDVRVFVELAFEGGEAGEVELFTGLRVPVRPVVVPGEDKNAWGLVLDGEGDPWVDVVHTAGSVAGMDALFENLVRTIIVDVLLDDVINGALAAIPFPAIDVSDKIPGLPPGAVISFEPISIGTEAGTLFLSAQVL